MELHGAISLSLGPAVVIVVVFHRRLLLLPTAAAHAPRTQREAALKRQRTFSVRSPGEDKLTQMQINVSGSSISVSERSLHLFKETFTQPVVLKKTTKKRCTVTIHELI